MPAACQTRMKRTRPHHDGRITTLVCLNSALGLSLACTANLAQVINLRDDAIRLRQI
jgi:hypothetical protein